MLPGGVRRRPDHRLDARAALGRRRHRKRDKPSLSLVVGSRDAASATALVQLAENVFGFLRRSPEIQKSIPGLAKVLPEFKPTVASNRVMIDVDAKRAAAILDADGARSRGTLPHPVHQQWQAHWSVLHRYHLQHNSFPPAYSSKDGKPLLSWRVLILPFLDQNDLLTAVSPGRALG